jgi:hypothetical protein
MKTHLLRILMLVVAVGFVGCDKIKEAATITLPTHLTTAIPVTISSASGMKSLNIQAIPNPFSFSVNKTYSLTDNVDIEPYLDKVKAIDLTTVVVTVSGLSGSEVIHNLSLSVDGVGTIFTKDAISATNNSFPPTVDAAILDQVGTNLKNNRTITFTVAGTGSTIPMTFTVSLNIGANVIAYVIN